MYKKLITFLYHRLKSKRIGYVILVNTKVTYSHSNKPNEKIWFYTGYDLGFLKGKIYKTRGQADEAIKHLKRFHLKKGDEYEFKVTQIFFDK